MLVESFDKKQEVFLLVKYKKTAIDKKTPNTICARC